MGVALAEVKLVKPSDETIAAATANHDDADLAFAVGANEVWLCELLLFVNGANSTMDFKHTLAVPSGTTGFKGVTGGGTNNGIVAPDTASTTAGISNPTLNATLGTAGVTSAIHQLAVLLTDVLAGRVKLQWSQNTSDAGNLTVLAGSSLQAWRLA